MARSIATASHYQQAHCGAIQYGCRVALTPLMIEGCVTAAAGDFLGVPGGQLL